MADRYDAADYPPFAVAVDLVVLTIRGQRLNLLGIRRGEPPFKGKLALPGGFVRKHEDLFEAATRELEEETGVPASGLHLEQLATYGAPRRDPRMRVVSVAYLALAADLPDPVAGTDAASAQWNPCDEIENQAWAFDHRVIIGDGIERARAKLEYTTLATAFCPAEFTIAELRHVYEIVWDTDLDPRNFHRKVMGTVGFVTPTEGTTTRGGGRPAQLYRPGPAQGLHPPLVRA